MSLFRDDGIVLRTQKLGEADRIITLLTRGHGRVRAVARGVRRTKSKFGARLEPFSHVDVQFFARGSELIGRGLPLCTQTETIAPYGQGIVADYARYTAGTAMLETAERFTDHEGEPNVQQYLLLVGGLRTLSAGDHAPGLVLDAFLLRSLAMGGYAPSFDDCAKCGLHGPNRFFSVASGGVVCGDCRVPGSVVPSPETLRLLGALLTGDWATADASEARHAREGTGLVSAYLHWHMERGLRSLRYVDRTTGPAAERRPGPDHPGPDHPGPDSDHSQPPDPDADPGPESQPPAEPWARRP
ncbi:DNA repair protein RecO [Streptomyces sp. HNM0575]|uniref:DNA repair protein RecO n=2 Tax=unclassified Streptomyces TaxID=2593676 RepID=UPI00145DE066|nr:DNA repair protein RecO [Streptomyces sp. HNM0575]NLU71570.1 DNA repair protein RecO [Streptomyces sp. HNM0575]